MKRPASLTHSLTRVLIVVFVLILLLGKALPALADYLGPDRTRTESHVETYDYGVWAKPDPTGNSCSHTYGTDCVVCTWERDPGSPCGDATYWYKLGTRSEVVTTTITYPEAAISAALQNCTLQNGWCITAPSLSLTASEPVSGYHITLIEGARDGETFACSGDACDVPLLEGENTFTFWALSSWGDSSRMGSLTARVDTRPPQINGTMSGTTGDNGWYLSAVTVSASASDPEPGSGSQALTYALDGGAWTPYAAPLTVNDGTHTLTFRAADRAGHTAETSLNVRVDTQPPVLQTALDGEQANGWYLTQVTLTVTAAESGSGLARIEYAAEGGAWQPYTAPVTFGDGAHSLRIRAVDLAGNAAESAPLTFRVDGAPPRIRLTDAWYLGQTGEVKVSDEQSGLAGVEIEIRDGQGRWQKVSRAYEANGDTFTTTIAWDRRFGDGTLAPIGTYDVLVTARDRAGNTAQETARIIIPAPGVTVTPAPTRTPPPSATPQSSFSIPNSSFVPPTATRAASVAAFQSSESPITTHPSSQSPITTYQSSTPASSTSPSTPLFGAAALTAIAAATAYALEQRRKRKEEEARQAAEAAHKAAARNAAEAAQRVQNWLIGQQIKKMQEAQHRAMDAKIERMEETERAAWEAWKNRSQTLAAQRAEEKRQQAANAWAAYRAGERANYEPATQPKSLWQRAGEWVQEKVDKFVMHPPSWLSVSYSPQEFGLGNYTAARWVSYQPLARNLWEGVAYQQVDVGLKIKPTLTTNPDGVVDVNLGDGTITFNGKNGNFFIQPTALSFGWGGSLKPDNLNPNVINVNQTVIDFDLGGPNFLSLKVSHAEGSQMITKEGYVENTKVQEVGETDLEVTVNVHRWPRVVAAVGAVYVLFQAGVLEAVSAGIPVLAERLVPATQKIFQFLQQAPLY